MPEQLCFVTSYVEIKFSDKRHTLQFLFVKSLRLNIITGGKIIIGPTGESDEIFLPDKILGTVGEQMSLTSDVVVCWLLNIPATC